MTKNDFIALLIKGIGFFTLSGYILNNFYFLFSFDQFIMWPIIVQLLVFIIHIVIIINASKIVRSLNLTKGIETDFISLGHISSQRLLQSGLIIVGVFLLITNVANLIVTLLMLFVWTNDSLQLSSQLVPSLVKILLGFLVIYQSGRIANLLPSDKS